MSKTNSRLYGRTLIKMESAVVTGAGGFVGSNLVRFLLDKDIRVFAIVLKESRLDKALVEDKNLKIIYCEKGKENLAFQGFNENIDVFYNLAWRGAGGDLRANYSVQLSNVESSLRYFQIAKILNCKKFISVGTIAEYMVDEMIEKNQLSMNFFYATSKKFCEKMLRIMANDSSVRMIWCTLGGLYGVGDNTNNLVNYTINNLLGEKLTAYGEANQIFDFIHIKDCCKALFLIGEKESVQSERFYIGSGAPRPLKEYLMSIKNIISPNVELGIGKRKEDGVLYKKEWMDIAVLQKETGYKADVNFSDGIKEILKKRRKDESPYSMDRYG